MSILTIITGVIAANALTFGLGYSLWRLRKNEDDMRAKILGLVILAIIGSTALLAP